MRSLSEIIVFYGIGSFDFVVSVMPHLKCHSDGSLQRAPAAQATARQNPGVDWGVDSGSGVEMTYGLFLVSPEVWIYSAKYTECDT